MRSLRPLRSLADTWVVIAICALVVTLYGSPKSGQGSTTASAVQGVVSDQNGGLIPGAVVTVTQKETGLTRTTSSDESGNYSIGSLPPGHYTFRVGALGFSDAVQDIELSAGQTRRLRITLNPGGVSIVVDTPVVDVTKSEVSGHVTAREIENLPVDGRSFAALAILIPTGRSQEFASTNNQSGEGAFFNGVTIDGLDANNSFFGNQPGGSLQQSLVSRESVDSMQVISAGASAEFGRSSGQFINISTKSGTNEFHGSAYLKFQDQALASQNPGAVAALVPTKDFRRYLFGATVGGPIKPNGAFFFVSYERMIWRRSKFNRIDPRLVRIFAERFGTTGEQGLIDQQSILDSPLARVDLNLSTKQTVTVSYGYSFTQQQNGVFDVPNWSRSANGREESRMSVFNATLKTILTPTMINEFRFQYALGSRAGFYEGPDIPDVSVSGMNPQTTEPTSYRFGRPFFLPRSSVDTQFQFLDHFTKSRGKHSLKVGVEFSRARIAQTESALARGRYIFASVEAFEAYLVNPANNGLLYYQQFAPVGVSSIQEAGSQEFTQLAPAFFIQDVWSATTGVTVNYGVRYDAQIQDQSNTPLSARRYGEFIGQPGFPSDGSIPSDKKGWQPRLGIAWDLFGNGNTVIRAHAGIYYARVPGSLVAGARNTDGATAFTISTCCGLEFLPTPPANLGIYAGTEHLNPGVRVFSSDFKNPRTLQWTASAERLLIPNLSIKFGFTYENSVHLTRFVDRNGPTFTGNFAPDGRRVFDGPRPFARADGSGIGELATAESSARSLYRSFNFNLDKRFSNGYFFGVNYALSWDYSDHDEENPYLFSYADVLDFRPEYGYSDRDQRHRFNAYGQVELPYGFALSGTFQVRAALPDSLFLLEDANRDGHAYDRPFVARRDVGRNAVRKRNRSASANIRIERRFMRRERKRAQLFVEIFNTFNSTNALSLSNPLLFNFDTRARAGFDDPRRVEIGFRFSF